MYTTHTAQQPKQKDQQLPEDSGLDKPRTTPPITLQPLLSSRTFQAQEAKAWTGPGFAPPSLWTPTLDQHLFQHRRQGPPSRPPPIPTADSFVRFALLIG